MTDAKAAAQAWMREYERSLDDRLRRERLERELAEIRQQGADRRRKEERLSTQLTEASVRLHRLMNKPLPVREATRWLRMLAADTEIEDRTDLERWRDDIARKAATMGVEVSYDVWADVNAYAFPRLKRIEISPINSTWAYATALHELGHCANPCQPSHRRAKTSYGHTVCVACECGAWRWGIRNAVPHWTRRMHNELQDALRTYRKYAAGDEVKEIDALIATGYHDARLARLKEI